MNPKRSVVWLLVGAGVLVAVGLMIGAWLPAGVALTLTPVRGGPPLVTLVMAPEETFTIHYMHSVEHAPIWETHSIDAQGRIYIEEERYLKFGAGMGKMPGVGRMVRRGPYEVIEAMHMATGDFILRIGSPGVDHTLIYRDEAVNLSAIAPHMAVQFSARPVNGITRLLQRGLTVRTSH